jgi:hypothetical protein
MPSDLASHLLRKSIVSMRAGVAHCGRCRRSPLPGELLHVLEGGESVCALCRGSGAVASADGTRRVRTGHPRLRVTPLAR